MTLTTRRLTNDPPSRRRQTYGSLQNVTLIPASELSSLPLWQERAKRLPAGNTLLVLPWNNLHLQVVGECIRHSLQQRGRHSTLAQLAPHPRQTCAGSR